MQNPFDWVLESTKAMSIASDCEYAILHRWFAPRNEDAGGSPPTTRPDSRLRTLLGSDALESLKESVVVDVGCGEGREAVDLALSGARRVVGIDIRESVLSKARALAEQSGVGSVCHFTSAPTIRDADAAISIDAFEHFSQPDQVLRRMYEFLRPGGRVLISFGPPWLHPSGGHLFSVFPWAHLLFTEQALIRWRSDFKSDGATRFTEVEGGLNQMTIARFEQLIASSPFRVKRLEAVPIRRLRFAHNKLTREFTSAIVRCELDKVE